MSDSASRPAFSPYDIAARTLHLKDVFDSHGFPLQQTVVRSAQAAFEQGRSRWIFETTELPVQVNDCDSRIDVLLRHADHPHFLSIECKRANPAYCTWCFAKSRYIRRNRSRDYLFVDCGVAPHKIDTPMTSQGYMGEDISSIAFHLGISIARDPQVNKPPKERDDLETACSQACLGTSGLLGLWGRGWGYNAARRELHAAIPCVVTTAPILVCELPLQLDTTSNELLSSDQIGCRESQWIAYQYPTSLSRRPSHHAFMNSTDMAVSLDADFIRTVFVVQAHYFGSFLAWLGMDQLGDLRPIVPSNL